MIYTTATFGIGVKSFYCCNKLKSTSFSFANASQKTCGMKMMKEKDDCCKTQFKYVKVKDSHVASDYINSPAKVFTDLHFAIPSFVAIVPENRQESIGYAGNAPPLHNGIPLYIFDCIYRI